VSKTSNLHLARVGKYKIEESMSKLLALAAEVDAAYDLVGQQPLALQHRWMMRRPIQLRHRNGMEVTRQ
jgi:hypothetical protein